MCHDKIVLIRSLLGKVTGMSKKNVARAFLILILPFTPLIPRGIFLFLLKYLNLWGNYHTYEIRFVGVRH